MHAVRERIRVIEKKEQNGEYHYKMKRQCWKLKEIKRRALGSGGGSILEVGEAQGRASSPSSPPLFGATSSVVIHLHAYFQ